VNVQAPRDIAATLVAGAEGLLAMDESTPTRNRRFAGLDTPEATRRAYPELLVTTPGLCESISGATCPRTGNAISPTIGQATGDGHPLNEIEPAAAAP
jgi:fructose-bisphosphate aldolase class 1